MITLSRPRASRLSDTAYAIMPLHLYVLLFYLRAVFFASAACAAAPRCFLRAQYCEKRLHTWRRTIFEHDENAAVTASAPDDAASPRIGATLLALRWPRKIREDT